MRDPAGQDDPQIFQVRLANFEGPFDLLLTLISRRKLDVTEIALSQVTDEFLSHVSTLDGGYDLGQVTEFLVVAATLLELKAARLLPVTDSVEAENLELLEARDLLFARLLQYRAYKEVATQLAERERLTSPRHPREVELEARFAQLAPSTDIGVGLARFAAIAAQALAPRPVPLVEITHVHQVRVSVAEQAGVLVRLLRQAGRASFGALVADCAGPPELVARFLALLELYRQGECDFEQDQALGQLWVRWLAADLPGQLAATTGLAS